MTEAERKRLVALPVVLAFLAAWAWAGSKGGVSAGSIPLFTLCVLLAVGINWVVFVPSFFAKTERFFDLTGSLTYLTVVIVAVEMGPAGSKRSILLASLIAMWALRLGYYLFSRIRADGSDGRFDEIRGSFIRFLVAWTLQGLWVSVTAGAALAAMTSARANELDVFAYVGFAIWIFGFGFEVAADTQKSNFRDDPANEGRFISTGLWAWSRHPNYFGEIVLWLGIAVIAFPALEGWQLVTLFSPVFVFLLLTRISGINLLEPRADARWGDEPDYRAYKESTPVLVPRPPR